MSKLRFSVDVSTALARAPSDPEAAAEVLKLAAEYLRTGEPMPEDLARFLADAFDSTAKKPATERAATLALNLHITAGNRRPAANWVEVGMAVEQLVDEGKGKSQFAAETECAERFGISEETVRRYWREFRIARAKERDLST